MAVAVGTAWEDSKRSGLETGADQVTSPAGTADLGNSETGNAPVVAGEAEAVDAVESVKAFEAAAEAGVAEESRGVTGPADWGAGEVEAFSVVESVGVSGVVVVAGLAEAFKGVRGTVVEVDGGSCAVETAVGVEASGEEAPLLPTAGLACASGDVGGVALSAFGVESPPGDKAEGAPLACVEGAAGVGINRGGFCCAGLGTGLARRIR